MFITFEGIDGAGKSTQVRKLRNLFLTRETEVLTLREPGGTDISEKIRELLLEGDSDITPTGELLLFAASRAELVQRVITPALDTGAVVILDRFYDSTTAYQGYGRKMDLDIIHRINSIASCGLEPDLTFYLDLSPEDALIRKFSEKSLPLAFEPEELDRMERSGLDFYTRVREGYLELAASEPHRFRTLDALQSPEELHRIITETVLASAGSAPER
ncbi:MAG: dTMP kinase [Prosthecochloris sp.]|uniref:dTMP kinase n=1 Tax=Prosthecochloris sp. ZM_2 TaxID=2045206 RepID=UPI000DF8116C|nr:dTMP kinase [Prosthecochloris sp. ZM_2]MEC9487517.1 dTMP kinase [Prosthecochloris sp.]RNA64717.1 dTMP kinase [Prosthecochloris sp. ZM_2]